MISTGDHGLGETVNTLFSTVDPTNRARSLLARCFLMFYITKQNKWKASKNSKQCYIKCSVNAHLFNYPMSICDDFEILFRPRLSLKRCY